MTKSVFIHLLKTSEAEPESLVYISNFLVMVGFKFRTEDSKAAT